MIDKIKNALGEELTKQVEEALKDKGIELAVANDGTVVPADKHETLKAELAQKETLIKGLQDKITEISKYETDNAELKQKLEEADKNAKEQIRLAKEEADKTVSDMAKKAILQKRLIADKADPNNVDLLLIEFDLDKVQLNDKKDDIIGYNELVTPVKEKRSILFAQVTTEGTPPANGRGTPPAKSYQERYNEAKKSGDNLAAIKIKQEAFEKGEII